MGTWLAENAIALVLSLVGSFLATLFARKIGVILDAVESKFNIDIDDKLEVRIQNTVRKVVMAITQTYVKGLKKSGRFDKEAKGEALKKAVDESKKLIFVELGIRKSEEVITLAVEAELAEQKEVEKIIGGANGPKGYAKKKKGTTNS